MDKNAQAVIQKRIDRTVAALRKNRFDAHFIPDKKTLYEKIDAYIAGGKVVSWGGSMTLYETGVIEHLRTSENTCLDRDLPGADKDGIAREAFKCDVFFSSSNAITEDGMLYNVDGRGNRVAAICFGPEKVVIVAGSNKIVPDLEAARRRVRETAAPANNLRLDTNLPCTKTGRCMDCHTENYICVEELVTRAQRVGGRIAVLILEEEYGY